MTDVSPTGNDRPDPYASQISKMPKTTHYRVTPEMRKIWQKLFKHYELSDNDVRQINDTFTKTVGDAMNDQAQWAIKQQKDRHQKEKEEGGG